jgi:hypothetical protein
MQPQHMVLLVDASHPQASNVAIRFLRVARWLSAFAPRMRIATQPTFSNGLSASSQNTKLTIVYTTREHACASRMLPPSSSLSDFLHVLYDEDWAWLPTSMQSSTPNQIAFLSGAPRSEERDRLHDWKDALRWLASQQQHAYFI